MSMKSRKGCSNVPFIGFYKFNCVTESLWKWSDACSLEQSLQSLWYQLWTDAGSRKTVSRYPRDFKVCCKGGEVPVVEMAFSASSSIKVIAQLGSVQTCSASWKRIWLPFCLCKLLSKLVKDLPAKNNMGSDPKQGARGNTCGQKYEKRVRDCLNHGRPLPNRLHLCKSIFTPDWRECVHFQCYNLMKTSWNTRLF